MAYSATLALNAGEWLRRGLLLMLLLLVSPPSAGRLQGRVSTYRRVQIPGTTSVSYRKQLAKLAIAEGLPSISDFPLLAQAGLLMTYGADLDDLGRRLIGYMDKILKGARPADLPIERPVKLQLSVNLGTAKALGIKLPQSLLLRADEVIQ